MNRNNINSLKIVAVFLFLISPGSLSCSADGNKTDNSDSGSGHPFLIVKREQFKELRMKSTQEPWLSMKEDAIARSDKGFEQTGRVNAYYTES